jgi:hypothetical protein
LQQPLPPLEEISLYELRLDQLRKLIRANGVSFPSPVPTFAWHDRPDLQWKLVQLYFVRGWSCERIAPRYGLIRQRVCQILKTWKRRAVEMGYIEYIPPAENLRIVATMQLVRRPGWPAFAIFSSQPTLPPAALNTSSRLSTSHQHL